jgi:phage-related baseplate assembly protein
MANETVPQFVKCDPDDILLECKGALEELLGRELHPAQVEQMMLQFIVYREVLLRNRFNAAMSQMLFQFSTAPVLDYIAGLVAVERLSEARSGCTVKFTLITGHGNVIIPKGTRVATSDGNIIFATLEEGLIAPNDDDIDLSVLAEIPGKNGNNYAPGSVNKILDPLAFVSSVGNINTTGGGSDMETDEQLRERIRLAPSQYSSAGSRSSYLFYAKSANPLITDVSVSSPRAGTVQIVPLIETDEILNPKDGTLDQVIKDIKNACNAENVRPLTDNVEVCPPTKKCYNIKVNITLYEGADSNEVKEAITAALKEYSQVKRKRLSQDIIRSHIAQACLLPQVLDVEVVLPEENVVVGDSEFAYCKNINDENVVTVIKSNK